MRKKYDLVCIGDVVVDAFITLHEASVHHDLNHEHYQLCMSFADKIPYESLSIVPGVGNASNVAVGASRLGLNVAMLTAIGKDHYGKEILDVYKNEGVAAEFVRVNSKIPTNYHFVLTFKAERTILVKHEKFEYPDPRVLDARADWIYFSSIAEHTLPFHHKIASYLKRHPGIKMGFNPGTFQLRFGISNLQDLYKKTYVLFVNREEAEHITRKGSGTDVMGLINSLHALGPKMVVITDGPNGAYASDGVCKCFIPMYPDPKPPISRTGAGDAFSTGFMSALIYGLPMEEALRWAPIESMSVVQYFGAQKGLLTKRELLHILKKAPKSYKPRILKD